MVEITWLNSYCAQFTHIYATIVLYYLTYFWYVVDDKLIGNKWIS